MHAICLELLIVVIWRNILWQAFEKWSKASRGALVFEDRSPERRTTGIRAHFDVLFAKYAHGDKESFDGRGGIVAHSGYPMEGIIHFDGSEFWSVNGRRGLDLRYVRFDRSVMTPLSVSRDGRG